MNKIQPKKPSEKMSDRQHAYLYLKLLFAYADLNIKILCTDKPSEKRKSYLLNEWFKRNQDIDIYFEIAFKRK